MNVDELHRLAGWYAEQFPRQSELYRALHSTISHNATQPDKQPVEEKLTALTDFLTSQRFEELSLEQLEILKKLEVDQYLGVEGAEYVDSAVRSSTYDPATAAEGINRAQQALKRAQSLFSAYIEAVNNLGLAEADPTADEGLITIRVGFRNDVAIDNVTEWKNSAKEWYDIVRGLSMACGQKPEEVRVIGAANGSIILILAATATVTALLAVISKHISGIAKDIIGVRMEIENLRQKGLLTTGIETELRRLEKEKADGAVTTIQELVRKELSGRDGEVKTALSNSIKKLLTFNEKGGTVDFVAPEVEEADPEAEDGNDVTKVALLAAQKAIRDYQGEREGLKLLMSKGTDSE